MIGAVRRCGLQAGCSVSAAARGSPGSTANSCIHALEDGVLVPSGALTACRTASSARAASGDRGRAEGLGAGGGAVRILADKPVDDARLAAERRGLVDDDARLAEGVHRRTSLERCVPAYVKPGSSPGAPRPARGARRGSRRSRRRWGPRPGGAARGRPGRDSCRARRRCGPAASAASASHRRPSASRRSGGRCR